MAGRIRSLKPELLDDESNAGLSDAAWRLWVSWRLLADDHGNARAGDRYLAASVWQDTSRKVEGPRAELARAGKVTLYTAGGERFAHLNGWEAEQRIDNAGKPRVPGPPGDQIEENQPDSRVLAETRGEPPRVSEKFRSRVAGARASSPPDHRSPTTDHRSPTAEGESARGAAAGAAPTPWSSPDAKRSHPRGTRLPPDWSPSAEVEAWAEEHGIDMRPSLEAFRDHWTASARPNAVKRDWNAALRSWLRKDIESGKAVRVARPTPSRIANGEPPATREQVAELSHLFSTPLKTGKALLDKPLSSSGGEQ